MSSSLHWMAAVAALAVGCGKAGSSTDDSAEVPISGDFYIEAYVEWHCSGECFEYQLEEEWWQDLAACQDYWTNFLLLAGELEPFCVMASTVEPCLQFMEENPRYLTSAKDCEPPISGDCSPEHLAVPCEG